MKLRSFLFFLLGIAAGSVFFHLTLSNPYDFPGRIKRYSPLDTVEIVGLGSSYLANQVVPELLESSLQNYGIRTRFINVAYPGSDLIEINQDIQALAATSLPSLKYVLIDITNSFSYLQAKNIAHPRSLAINTPSVVSATWKRLRKMDNQFGFMAKFQIFRTLSLGLSALHFGIAGTHLQQWIADRRAETRFYPMPTDPRFDPKQYEVVKLKAIQSLPSRQIASKFNPSDWAECGRPEHNEWRKLFAPKGIKVIFVAAPTLYPERCLRVLKDPLYLNFLNIDEYPELYETEMRSDNMHVNEEGADLYTIQLAKGLSRLLKEEKTL